MKNIMFISILLTLVISCNMLNTTKKPGKPQIKIEDTLTDYLIADLTEDSLVTDTVYRIELNNKAVVKTIDSIINTVKNKESRMWEIYIYKDYYMLVYSLRIPLFYDKDDLSKTYYSKMNNSTVWVKIIDTLNVHLKKYKRGILIRHVNFKDVFKYYGLPFDHPMTFYINQGGKIILTRFMDSTKLRKESQLKDYK